MRRIVVWLLLSVIAQTACTPLAPTGPTSTVCYTDVKEFTFVDGTPVAVVVNAKEVPCH